MYDVILYDHVVEGIDLHPNMIPAFEVQGRSVRACFELLLVAACKNYLLGVERES